MICVITNCNRKARGNQHLCETCKTRLWRLQNPERACFLNLRSNAKRRGKPFLLTFEQFQQFCTREDYMVGKGRTKTSYSIDCKKPEEGYHYDNLQKLTVSENSSKGTKKLEVWWDEYEKKLKAKVTKLNEMDNSDCPF